MEERFVEARSDKKVETWFAHQNRMICWRWWYISISISIYIYISCGGIGHVEDMTTVQKLGLSSSWPRVENPWFSAWQHWLGAHF
jgi:hypothetical protein